MKKRLASDAAHAIGIVGGLASTIGLYQIHPWIAYSAMCLLAAWVTALVYRARSRTIDEIKKGVWAIERHLKEAGFRPDIVIAFSRTSAVFAGILSVRMGVDALLVIHRVPEVNTDDGTRTFHVGFGVSLDPGKFAGRNLLVVAYFLETGTSLQTGLEYLTSQGIARDRMKVTALYCTPAGRKRFPGVFVVHQTSEEVLDGLPWLDGPYGRV